ncbi:MAG: uracil-DNA glycosylase family protein, partial [Comamonadaceae bacterium]
MPLDLDTRQRAMLKEMGVEVWLPSQPTRAVAKAAPITSVTPAPRAASGQPNSQSSSHSSSHSNDLSKINTLNWDALADTASQCQACGLCGGRKNSTLVAMPDGALATWMVVGDPPDEEEDAIGAPFAGDAGLLLDNMLKAVCAVRMGAGKESGAQQSKALVTNITKCRPPQGRIPQAAELAQ